jgi:hypothetical protein
VDQPPNASPNVLAPCGPDCRFAQNLPTGDGDWIWCARTGSPRFIGASAADCPWFGPRRNPVSSHEGFFAGGDTPPSAG